MKLVDIQTLNVDLSSGVGLNSSANLSGEDLTKVVVSGSGELDFNSATIVGSNTGLSFDGSAATGSIALKINSDSNAVSNIKGGKGADNIEINGVKSSSGGLTVNSDAGNDVITITTNGDGANAIIDINGGNDTDKLVLNSGVDLSATNLTLTSVEKISIPGNGISPKMAASDISTKSFTLEKEGSGNTSLTVVADQNTLDLSSLQFASSFAFDNDSIIINGSTSSSGITVTGSNTKNLLTGSNANDILSGGSRNDTISGGTGDDSITGKTGSDSLTGGAGDDVFNFSALDSTQQIMDKITDFQAAAADSHNDSINNVTGSRGANVASLDVKAAISGDSTGKTVTAAVANGIVTLSGTNSGLINTLEEWLDVISINGVIVKAADDADAVGTVAFEFNGNTYVVESNDTFNNNTPNVAIVNIIELTGLTNAVSVAEAAAANTIMIA